MAESSSSGAAASLTLAVAQAMPWASGGALPPFSDEGSEAAAAAGMGELEFSDFFSVRRPKHLFAGMSSGMQSVAKGGASGAACLVGAPVAGAYTGGFGGFLGGVIAGAVSVRPLSRKHLSTAPASPDPAGGGAARDWRRRGRREAVPRRAGHARGGV